MKGNDDQIREYFVLERLRDSATVPPFEEVAGSSAQGSTGPRPTRHLRALAVVGALVAAAVLAAVMIGGLGSNGTEPKSPPTELAGLDEVCDAALAALDELENEARLGGSTDVLLESDSLWNR